MSGRRPISSTWSAAICSAPSGPDLRGPLPLARRLPSEPADQPERQSWKCWVCDIGGDVFSFVMQREGVEFREALEMLADRAGSSLTTRRAGGDTRQPGRQTTLYQAMAWAEQQFQRACAGTGRRSRPAVISRTAAAGRASTGFTSASRRTAGSGCWTAPATPFTPAVLAAAGLAARSEQPAATTTIAFADACCFPSAIPKAGRSPRAAAFCRERPPRTRRNTSTRRKHGCSPRATNCTGWTWPAITCRKSREWLWSKGTPT